MKFNYRPALDAASASCLHSGGPRAVPLTIDVKRTNHYLTK